MRVAYGDLAALAIAAILAVGFGRAVALDRARRRGLMRAIHHETRGLSREAAELAEAVCRRAAQGDTFDQSIMERFELGEPQTYPGLVPDLWRLHPVAAARLVAFHGRLAVARKRWAAWKANRAPSTDPYLLASALTRAVNEAQPVLWHIEDRMGWARSPTPEMTHASAVVSRVEDAFIEGADDEAVERLDAGYWSV